jgi:hypothetical protein
MRSLLAFCLVSTALLAGGCAGFFEQEIKLNALPYERQLVLTSILSPQDSVIRADVFVTAPAVGNPPPDYPPNGQVTDAQVMLVAPAGSIPFESTTLGRSNTYTLPQTTARLEAGQTYEVVAEWDGLTARGRVTIPEQLIVRDSIALREVVEDDGDRYVRASWPNQGGEQDYYLLFTERIIRFGGNRAPNVQRELWDFLHGRNSLGPYINGELGIRSDVENTLNICQTTQATFNYLQTRSTLEVNDENPFAEPTTVANDLDQGLGLVGAANCQQFTY